MAVETIRYIADKVNVSISTVSGVIKKTEQIGAEIKKRVCSLIDKQDFEPNQIARCLVTGKIGMITIIILNLPDAVRKGSVF